MADFASSLPVRTQTNGDIVAKLCDGTTNTQLLKINSDGTIDSRIYDVAGTGLTSTTVTTHQALDVNVVAGSSSGAVADESTFTYGTSMQTPVGGVFNTSVTALTSGQTGAFSCTATRAIWTNLRNSSGTELGDTAAHKIFVQPTDGTNNQAYTAAGEAKVDVTASAAFGSASGGTAATSSDLVGGIYNSSAPTLTNGQQASLQLTVSGNLKTDLTTIVGSAPGATNALPTQIATSGAFVSETNPLPVTIGVAGTNQNYYTDSSAVASTSSVTQSTTVGGATGFYLQSVATTSSGKNKAIIQVETASGSGTFNIVAALFNSTATPNSVFNLPTPRLVPTGARVQIIMTNLDLTAQDLYSTVSGYQI